MALKDHLYLKRVWVNLLLVKEHSYLLRGSLFFITVVTHFFITISQVKRSHFHPAVYVLFDFSMAKLLFYRWSVYPCHIYEIPSFGAENLKYRDIC